MDRSPQESASQDNDLDDLDSDDDMEETLASDGERVIYPWMKKIHVAGIGELTSFGFMQQRKFYKRGLPSSTSERKRMHERRHFAISLKLFLFSLLCFEQTSFNHHHLRILHVFFFVFGVEFSLLQSTVVDG